jgi:hypothetical protein
VRRPCPFFTFFEHILIFISQIVEIFSNLCYSITGVGDNEGFRLIMMKPAIDEFAALKESIFNGQTPKGGSLIFIALMTIFSRLVIPPRE